MGAAVLPGEKGGGSAPRAGGGERCLQRGAPRVREGTGVPRLRLGGGGGGVTSLRGEGRRVAVRGDPVCEGGKGGCPLRGREYPARGKEGCAVCAGGEEQCAVPPGGVRGPGRRRRRLARAGGGVLQEGGPGWEWQGTKRGWPGWRGAGGVSQLAACFGTGLVALCLSEKVSSTLLFQALFCSRCNRFLPSPDPFCSSVLIVPWALNRLVEVWVQEGVLGISSEMQPLEMGM